MTIVLIAAVALLVVTLLVLVHRWLWIRLVRDTTTRGGAVRRTGTALAFALPLLSVAALVAGRAGAPSGWSARSPGPATSGWPSSCTSPWRCSWPSRSERSGSAG